MTSYHPDSNHPSWEVSIGRDPIGSHRSDNAVGADGIPSDNPEDESNSSKKRKIQRACDVCRRRKQRCNGFEMPDSRCSTCISLGMTCTYQETSKKRGPPKGYVESLESRLAKSEQLLAQLNPSIDIEAELGSPLDRSSFAGQRTSKKMPNSPNEGQTHSPTPDQPSAQPLKQYASRSQPYQTPSSSSSSSAIAPQHVNSLSTESLSHSLSDHPNKVPVSNNHFGFVETRAAPHSKPKSGTGDDAAGGMVDEEADLKSFAQLHHRDEQLFKRFQGKSSGLPLLFAAIGFKYGVDANRYGQEIKLHRTTSRSRFWRIPPWESTPGVFSSTSKISKPTETPTPNRKSLNGDNTILEDSIDKPRNPQLEAMMSANPFASWPDQGLDWRLIEGYFNSVNMTLPLLHRPTFYRQYASQLYNTDPGFARICLLVFAIGSYQCNDSRVLFPKEDGEGHYGIDSAGWTYYHAFGRMIRHRLAPTELWDLQVSVLLVQFVRHSSQPGACWLLVGEGLRYAQDIGVHRRGVKRSSDPVENEQFKRGFWCLYLLEREFSAFLGRPIALDQDFDVGLPAECDDDYWQTGDPLTAFTQPANLPSLVSSFVMNIKLHKILSVALTQLYNIKPVSQQSKTPVDVAAELDEQAHEWLLSVPDHLKWNPDQPDSIFYQQSVDLHLNFNMVLTYIHRPFLPSPRAPVSTSVPSFVACIAAASAAADIIDSYYQKIRAPYPNVFNAAYTTALILLIGYWTAQPLGLTDADLTMKGVDQCLFSLAEGEKVYFGVGRARDAITVLRAPRIDSSSNLQPMRSDGKRTSTSAPSHKLAASLNSSDLSRTSSHLNAPLRSSHLKGLTAESAESSDQPSFHQSLSDQILNSSSSDTGQKSRHIASAALSTTSNPAFTPPIFSPGSTGSMYHGSTPDLGRGGGPAGSFLGVYPDFFSSNMEGEDGSVDRTMSLFPSGDDPCFISDLYPSEPNRPAQPSAPALAPTQTQSQPQVQPLESPQTADQHHQKHHLQTILHSTSVGDQSSYSQDSLDPAPYSSSLHSMHQPQYHYPLPPPPPHQLYNPPPRTLNQLNQPLLVIETFKIIYLSHYNFRYALLLESGLL
ncbi:Zn(2)-C6 fungal-type DNA-binding domain [Phaffia rhodozyma]|uniref:Zn(2)-C6 fungal-type DNA-binding domain n=1 Tax=Phaffia rhodozyma TaxID=264483 RepID=A0A0F7SW04_PHARH|nr:Zn(2)-C6 fungal-type DNA-binding domain [Phaffia rhodozyma]